MKILKLLWTRPSQTLSKRWLNAIRVVSLLGFIDATYLTLEHFLGKIPTCFVVNGCERVLTSVYSQIFGVPLALFGSIFYLSILVLSFVYAEFKKEKFWIWLMLVSFVGFGASTAFIYIQLFILRAFCFYCLVSAASSTTIFILITVDSLATHGKEKTK